MTIPQERILILDFGSQYTPLIARRIRELHIYCEIHPYDIAESEILAFAPKGIILSGGPETVTLETTPRAPKIVFSLGCPVLGICYGMQLAVIEYARNVLGLRGAHTREVDARTPHPVIDIMPDQRKKLVEGDYGGSMRLGSYPAYLKAGTTARGAYKAEMVHERHRHRYEVNPEYVAAIEKAGLVFSGISPDKKLMEIAELPRLKHPFFLGTQFHPEFLARPLTSHPLFDAFMKAATR